VNIVAQDVEVAATALDVLSELLPQDLQALLDHVGAAQYDLPYCPEFCGDHFTVVATRSADDVSIEIRRRRIPDDDRIPEEFFTARKGTDACEPHPAFATVESPEMPRRLTPRPAATPPTPVPPPRRRKPGKGPTATVSELRALQREIKRMLPSRGNPQPEVQKSAAQLALTTFTCLRRALKRQAMDRMKQKTLSRKQVDAIAGDLMRLEQIIGDLTLKFGLEPSDLTLDSE
jgi:hypothetical protein